jgi:hypothetical protein
MVASPGLVIADDNSDVYAGSDEVRRDRRGAKREGSAVRTRVKNDLNISSSTSEMDPSFQWLAIMAILTMDIKVTMTLLDTFTSTSK